MSAATFFQADISQQGAMEKRYIVDASPEALSLFRGMYQRILPFGMESILQTVSDADFGKETSTKLHRAGDHLFWMDLQAKLPGLSVATGGTAGTYVPARNMVRDGCDVAEGNVTTYLNSVGGAEYVASLNAPKAGNLYGEVNGLVDADLDTFHKDVVSGSSASDEIWAIWCDEVGSALYKSIEIKCNNNRIDRFTREYLHAHNELFNRKDTNQMLGVHTSVADALRSSYKDQYLYTPVPAYFCRAMGNLFDLASALFTVPTINLTLAPAKDLIVASSDDLKITCASGDLKISELQIDSTQIVVPESERTRLHQHKHRQLITQVQSRSFSKKSSSKLELDVKFPNPCLELIFSCRRDCATAANMWFHFWGIAGDDPVATVELMVNSVAKEKKRPGEYFRKVKPYRAHTNVPVSCLYCMPFAIDPEGSEFPTGYFSLGRMDSAVLVLELQKGLAEETVEIFVHARTFNVLEYSNASAHPIFVSS